MTKSMDLYLELLIAIVRHCTSNTSSADNERHSDDFDLLNDGDRTVIKDYGRHISQQIFNCDYLFELFLGQHGKYAQQRQISKLSKTVTGHLAAIAKHLSECYDDAVRIISPRYSSRLTNILTAVVNRSVDWTPDLVNIVDGFWPVLSKQLRYDLLASLVDQPSDCLTHEDESSLNNRGQLVVRLLKCMTASEWSCLTADVAQKLFELAKLIPSESTLCDAIGHAVDDIPLLSDQGDLHEVVPVLLKCGCQSALSLVASLSKVNCSCRKAETKWIMKRSKRWNSPDAVPVFSRLIVSALESAKQGNTINFCLLPSLAMLLYFT
jgi:hypothetical protein